MRQGAGKPGRPGRKGRNGPGRPSNSHGHGSGQGSNSDAKEELQSLLLPEVEKQLASSPDGLTQIEAQRRRARYGPNEIKEKKVKPLRIAETLRVLLFVCSSRSPRRQDSPPSGLAAHLNRDEELLAVVGGRRHAKARQCEPHVAEVSTVVHRGGLLLWWR